MFILSCLKCVPVNFITSYLFLTTTLHTPISTAPTPIRTSAYTNNGAALNVIALPRSCSVNDNDIDLAANARTVVITPPHRIDIPISNIALILTLFINTIRIVNTARSMDDIINQYLATVKPMYDAYVAPCKRFADIIIPNDNKHDVALTIINAKIKDIIK